MEISNNGLSFLASDGIEGIRLKAYPDPATGGVPWTIGIGSTKVNGKPVKPGMTCTREEAFQYCKEHLKEEVYPIIEKYVKVDLNQNQFDALCSFIYNVGEGNFRNSTLLKVLNIGKYNEASNEFTRWVRANGKIMNGLVTRRKKEKEMFNKAI